MLEYTKTILSKVSFDKFLFEKELRKALRTILPEEIAQFKEWCYAQFAKAHRAVLNHAFGQLAL